VICIAEDKPDFEVDHEGANVGRLNFDAAVIDGGTHQAEVFLGDVEAFKLGGFVLYQ
jgi:hypothetical protein